MLRVEDIHTGYDRSPVLHAVSIAVEPGQIVAVLGRNGAGKTTLLRAIVGLNPIWTGRVLLDGVDVTARPAYQRARRGIGYVPQGRDIFPGLSVLDNLRVGAHGTGQRAWRTDLEMLLTQFPVLAEKRNQSGGSLSGGQQQLLAIARALMTRPRVLLLDEPSEGIQPSIVDQIAEAVPAISRERSLAVVLVEQNLDFAARLATDAFVFDRGRVARRLTVREMAVDRRLQHEYLGV
jgi:branched-chain amino acid transport system ATP-binding protein/urea transport system ATP-binding protein